MAVEFLDCNITEDMDGGCMELKIIESLEDENIRLKRKVNQLIDQVMELRNANEEAVAKELAAGQDITAEIPDENSGFYINLLGDIFRKIGQENMVIPHKKGSKKDKDFLKVDMADFAHVLGIYSKVDDSESEPGIYGFMAACGMIKTQVNGKLSWSDFKDGESIKVLLIRRSAFSYFLNHG